MNIDYLRQTDEPLFTSILWNKPVNQQQAGKLLIIGGHSQKFSQTQAIYGYALEAGAGTVKVVLPSSLRKLTGAIPDCLFAASNPSGSFAAKAQDEILGFIKESDTVMLAGELSQNSETLGLIEALLEESSKPIIITGETVRKLLHSTGAISKASAIVASPESFSELAAKLKVPIFVKTPNLQKELQLMQALGEKLDCVLISYSRHVLVAQQNNISMTPMDKIEPQKLLALAATYYMHHANKFQAITTAAWELKSGKTV